MFHDLYTITIEELAPEFDPIEELRAIYESEEVEA